MFDNKGESLPKEIVVGWLVGHDPYVYLLIFKTTTH